MNFYNEKFASAINNRIFSDQLKQGKRIGLRKVSKESGISTATLSRILHGKDMDIRTFVKLLAWLGHVPAQYIY